MGTLTVSMGTLTVSMGTLTVSIGTLTVSMGILAVAMRTQVEILVYDIKRHNTWLTVWDVFRKIGVLVVEVVI